jgi:hypothetical protein
MRVVTLFNDAIIGFYIGMTLYLAISSEIHITNEVIREENRL